MKALIIRIIVTAMVILYVIVAAFLLVLLVGSLCIGNHRIKENLEPGPLGKISGEIGHWNKTSGDNIRRKDPPGLDNILSGDDAILPDSNGGAGHNNITDSTTSMPSDNNQH